MPRRVGYGLRRSGPEAKGPEDYPLDSAVNCDPDSMAGEDSEEGFDDMPYESGWDDGDFEAEDEEDDYTEVYDPDESDG